MPDPGDAPAVVVTGLGALTPLGPDVATTWEGLVAGRSAIAPITRFDASAVASRIAGEVDGFDPVALMGTKRALRSARFSQFAVAAAREAAADACLVVDEEDAGRVGVVINNACSGIEPVEATVRTLIKEGPKHVSSFFVPSMIPSVPACEVAIDLGAHGPVNASALACASGTAAVLEARRLILTGEADVVVCGGTDAPLTEVLLAGLDKMRPLSTNNDDPQGASRPFDADRDGFVPAEGAVAVVLESGSHARARGARVYGEVAGGALTSDAFHLSAPERSGRYAAEAMRLALERGGVAPEDLGYVCAHGTGTRANDSTEAMAVRTVLGEATPHVPISSPKSMVGHLMGGAGTLSVLCCLLAIRDGVIPPTINLDTPDPECGPLDHVANEARRAPIRTGLANAFGFGGQNCVVLVRAV